MELEEADEIVRRVALSRRGTFDMSFAAQLAQMELEIQSLDRATKPKLQIKLRGYKADLQKRKLDVVRFLYRCWVYRCDTSLAQKNALGSLDRTDLLGGGARKDGGLDLEAGGGDGMGQTQAQRARLLAGTDKLSDGQRRLEDSHRVALETEEMGASILGNLHTQRDQIINTRDTVRLLTSEAGR